MRLKGRGFDPPRLAIRGGDGVVFAVGGGAVQVRLAKPEPEEKQPPRRRLYPGAIKLQSRVAGKNAGKGAGKRAAHEDDEAVQAPDAVPAVSEGVDAEVELLVDGDGGGHGLSLAGRPRRPGARTAW